MSFDGNKEEIINNVNIIRKALPFRGALFKKLSMMFYIKNISRDFDVIHAYNIFFYEYLGLLCKFFGTRIIGSLNNLPDIHLGETKNPLKKIKRMLFNNIRLKLMSNLNYFICISKTLKQEYLKKGFESQKIFVIPNMLDYKFLISLNRVKKSKKIYILFVGLLYKTKGVDILLRAVRESYRKHKNIRLNIIGKGSEYGPLNKLCAELKLKRITKFKENVDYNHIISEYDQADIFVHPGRWNEPFGRTIIEAMSRKVPVLVSNTGAPPIIVNEQDLTYEPEDFLELSNKLNMLIENKRLRIYFSKKLYKNSLRYTPERILPKIIRIYKTLL